MSNADLRWRFTETPPNLSILVASDDGVSEGNIARFQIHLGFRRRAKHARSIVVEFSFPSGDYDRSQTIPNEVYAGASHVHQFVDAKDTATSIGPRTAGRKRFNIASRTTAGLTVVDPLSALEKSKI